MAVEPGRRVAVGPGGGCGVAGRKEPVLSVALAGTFASSRAAQVLDAVKDEVGVGGPKDGAEVPPSKPEQSRLAVLHRGRAHTLDDPLGPMLRQDPEERCDPRADAAEHASGTMQRTAYSPPNLSLFLLISLSLDLLIS